MHSLTCLHSHFHSHLYALKTCIHTCIHTCTRYILILPFKEFKLVLRCSKATTISPAFWVTKWLTEFCATMWRKLREVICSTSSSSSSVLSSGWFYHPISFRSSLSLLGWFSHLTDSTIRSHFGRHSVRWVGSLIWLILPSDLILIVTQFVRLVLSSGWFYHPISFRSSLSSLGWFNCFVL